MHSEIATITPQPIGIPCSSLDGQEKLKARLTEEFTKNATPASFEHGDFELIIRFAEVAHAQAFYAARARHERGQTFETPLCHDENQDTAAAQDYLIQNKIPFTHRDSARGETFSFSTSYARSHFEQAVCAGIFARPAAEPLMFITVNPAPYAPELTRPAA